MEGSLIVPIDLHGISLAIIYDENIIAWINVTDKQNAEILVRYLDHRPNESASGIIEFCISGDIPCGIISSQELTS